MGYFPFCETGLQDIVAIGAAQKTSMGRNCSGLALASNGPCIDFGI